MCPEGNGLSKIEWHAQAFYSPQENKRFYSQNKRIRHIIKLANMCGIAGILSLNTGEQPLQVELAAMIARLHHRGPDGTGVFIDGAAGPRQYR